ncbi:uncharacterized mitochondrial protein AtMg00810-like [Arachis hypogaea]|uniref:uncharacterized mitochondrial protein AtMg00810-like n=1 Tax=Arachis hypogaea TaxID=3818 RepID=UPI003B210CDD
MDKEFAALQKCKTWELTEPPLNTTIIGSKWVFAIKKNAKGDILRYKFDFDNAFLNGTLNETVYIMQPPGYSTKGEQLVCKLNKAIYGLKQALRAWYKKLSTTLRQFGFKETRSDVSLFVRFFDSNVIYLLVYVDDIIVTDNNAAELDKLIYQLNNIFPLKDMGKFCYFLSLEASYLSTGSVHISQTKYACELLKRAGMETVNSMPTPMMSNTKLSAHYSEPFHDPKLYRSIVGVLQYLTMTRPYIAFAVNRVSQFMHQPTLLHWKSIKRILRYVKGTVYHGLLFSKSTDFRLLTFSDADWGGDLDDRKSITGFCIYLGCKLIS